LDKLS